MEKIEGIDQKLIDSILNLQIRDDVKRHIDYMNTHSIDIISIEDKEYPLLLKRIHNPPICLYIIGRKEILNEASIAIVGSRDATEYGKYVAKWSMSWLRPGGKLKSTYPNFIIQIWDLI